MAKSRTTAFFCKECGYESAKWSGQCPSCKSWNTFVEEPVVKEKNVKGIVNINAKYHETAGVKRLPLFACHRLLQLILTE